MVDPALLFVVFAAIAAGFAFGLAAHFRSRRLGAWLAVAVLLFFAVLFAGVRWLLATRGASLP